MIYNAILQRKVLPNIKFDEAADLCFFNFQDVFIQISCSFATNNILTKEYFLKVDKE